MAVPKVKRSEIFWEPRSPTPTRSRPGHGYGAEYEIRKSTRGRRLRANLRFRADRSAQ